jgi:hypothetical protein
MKKIMALFGSLLLFAGLKAQTPVKKETTKPATTKPAVNARPSTNDKIAPLKSPAAKEMKATPLKKDGAKPIKQ